MNQKIEYRSRFGLAIFYSNNHVTLMFIPVIAAVLRIDSKIV